jgi:NADH-quinone oxidoreductase subunit J
MTHMTSFLFYFFSAVALLSAVLVISLPKPTRALLSLIVTMFALSVLYLILGAPFFAMAHLIVYAGAVLVLFLFVIMLQGIGASEVPLFSRFRQSYFLLAGFVAVSFMAASFFLFGNSLLPDAKGAMGNIEIFGEVLFRDYLLPFELTSLLLLIGVFAAIGLAKKDPE